MISVDPLTIFDEDSEEDLDLFDLHPRLKLHEALQILQLDETETASRDVIKEQYLKLATPVHPHHLQIESRQEFRKLSIAFYAALCTFECPHCKFFNCKECWLAKDLVHSVLKLSQDLEKEEDELERYSTDELYFFTLEKFVVNLKYCRKKKEKIPSTILSEKDEENLCVFFQLLVEEKDNVESSSEEETEENISLEQDSTSIGKHEEIVAKPDCVNPVPKKKNRKAKAKVAKEPYKTKSLSKSEAIELDVKRNHEIENIRRDILKRVKLANEPKHQKAHIAVRKEVLDRDMKDEIERQRQEKENHLQEVLKRRKLYAAKEKATDKKLKRILKKKNCPAETPHVYDHQNLNSSSSSYPNSSSDTSFYTSSNVHSMDSSCDTEKNGKQGSGQCIGQPEPMTRLDVVSENPLLEDRKRVVNPAQKAQVEESKKLKLNKKEELTCVNSGCDKGAILAKLHQKERQKNMSDDEAMERIGRRNRKSRTKKKCKNNLSNTENTPGVTYEPRIMQNFLSSTTTVSVEKSPTSSYFCSSAGRNAERKLFPPVCMSSPLENSSHVRGFCYSHEPSQPVINQIKISYADIAVKSISQSKAQPEGRPHIHKTSVQSFTFSANDTEMSQVLQPLMPRVTQNSKTQKNKIQPPGFYQSQVYSHDVECAPGPMSNAKTTMFEAQTPRTFSRNIPEQFTFSAKPCLHSDRNEMFPPIGHRCESIDGGMCQSLQGKGMCNVTNAHVFSKKTLNNLDSINFEMKGSAVLRHKDMLKPHLLNDFNNRSPSSLKAASSSQNINIEFTTKKVKFGRKCIPNENSDSNSVSKDMKHNNTVEELQRGLSDHLRITESELSPCSNAEKPCSSLDSPLRSLNLKQVPDNWDDGLTNDTHDETIEKGDCVFGLQLLAKAGIETQTDKTCGHEGNKHVEKRNDYMCDIKNLTSIWETDDMDIPANQKTHSVTVDVNDKESAKYTVIDSVFHSFENFSLEEKSEQNEKNSKEVESKMSSELRTEKRKCWTWLAPQDKRKKDSIPKKTKESVQKKGLVMSKSNQFIKSNEGASRPRRVHFESENIEILSNQRSVEDASPSCRLPNQQHISNMRDGHIKSDKNESLAGEILTKRKLKQILNSRLILCSQEKASGHDLQPTQHVPCRKENVSTSCQEKVMSVCKSQGENWNEESGDCFDSSSLSHNFMAATQSNVRFSSHGFLEQIDVDSTNRNICDPSGLEDSHLEQKAFTQNALGPFEFQNKKILHPIRKPKTATQCMQISQAKMNKYTKSLAGNTATKDPCNKLSSRSSGNTGAVPDFKTAEQDKSCKLYEEITNTAQRQVKPAKRLSNPSALLQNALMQLEKERDFFTNRPSSIHTKSREGNNLRSASGTIQFPPKPSIKTVEKLPKLNIAGFSGF